MFLMTKFLTLLSVSAVPFDVMLTSFALLEFEINVMVSLLPWLGIPEEKSRLAAVYVPDNILKVTFPDIPLVVNADMAEAIVV
ncbi:MAG: hypothetical protein BWY27_01421 [Bacteroidetes bacterium ADurb.Bin234]|nr:MAG: hypothetical protein BWY27_01421 [Bacteroidetes bacterium ADurb.Bin234]